jgi:hypothetical protein
VSCVFPLRVCCGYWLGLAPRSGSTSVAVWTWQEKLAEVNGWNRVHRPNSWIEFLSAPIHSPPLWFAVSVLHSCRASWSSHEVLDELYPEVSHLAQNSCINIKLQSRHARMNFLYQGG